MRRISIAIVLLVATLAPVGPAQGSSCSSGPLNDCLDDAIEWRANPASFSNVGATMEPGEPSQCDGATVHRSIWLKLEVLEPGGRDGFKVNLDAGFFITAGAYTQASDGALSVVTCRASSEDEGLLYSPALYLPCTAGAVYWIQLGGQSPADQGTFSIFESRYWKFEGPTLSDPCPFKPSLPGAPHMWGATGGAGTVAGSWSAPYWQGGRGVTVSGYEVYRATGSCSNELVHVASTSGTSYTDNGLGEMETYCYRVAAVNVAGEGPLSNGVVGTTWARPGAPTGLAVTRGGAGELLLSWSPPASTTNAPVGTYGVYTRDAPGAPASLLGTTAAGTRTFTHDGLPDGHTRHYEVSASNAVGEGAASAPASGTTWAIPGAPRDVQASSRVGTSVWEVVVTWKAPAEPTPFTHYRVYRASGPLMPASFVGEVPATATSFVDRTSGFLTDDYWEVRASNPAGEGEASPRACTVFPLQSPLARCA